jgi:hypothetical protein
MCFEVNLTRLFLDQILKEDCPRKEFAHAEEGVQRSTNPRRNFWRSGRINSFGVIETMMYLMFARGVAKPIRPDNGAEMTTKVIRN